ncbi:hypothetical protein BRADI_1g29820v3 [Brachypodium distachyon]|uniref:C2H2-type domain-containing protein n=1 Tax=Brachypodium distachyon TaxID=15368 RepID=I1GV76_BRADI|nr:hypothetical protein BRADI_1g29820v3 [Brachypodium distachyon]
MASSPFVMSGAGQVHPHLLASSGGGGGDDPSNNWPYNLPSSHALDTTAVVLSNLTIKKKKKKKKKKGAGAGEEGPLIIQIRCPVCERTFRTPKGVHGHMRVHTDRGWRGMDPAPPPPPHAAAGYRYECAHCGTQFPTRQSLGGHRASHSGIPGCSELSRIVQLQQQQQRVVRPFDLNELPATEAEEENEDPDGDN